MLLVAGVINPAQAVVRLGDDVVEPEHRGRLSQCGWDLQESGHAGEANDHLRRREADRGFTCISDVAPAIARSVEREESYNQAFNIGADQPCSILELSRVVADAMGTDPAVEHLPARNEVVHAFSSHDRVRPIFGDLIGDLPLQEGIRRMAAWATDIPVIEGEKLGRIEIEKNMPSF